MFTTTIDTLYRKATEGIKLSLDGQELMMAEKVTSERGQTQVLFISNRGTNFLFPADAEIRVGESICGQAEAIDAESGQKVVLSLRDGNMRPCLSLPEA